jgi:hypothetical protein
MKRVLFDHCVPRPFRGLLEGCEVSTTFQMGWALLKNGELLNAAEADGFEVLITSDKNLRYQQHLATRRIAIIKLPTNRIAKLSAYAPQTNAILQTIKSGDYKTVSP